MKIQFWIPWLLCVLFVLGAMSVPRFVQAEQAVPPAAPTAFKTPTPGPDGRIFYLVQPEDTLWSISAITGISVDQLRSMNSLHPEEAIRPGQQIFLGMGGPALFTPTPGPTAILPTPTLTPTPEKGTAKLCILLYDDINGDSMRQEDEPSISGGAVNITGQAGQGSLSKESGNGLDPQCFDSLTPGDYSVSVAVPPGYNSTTDTNALITLKAGDETYMNFGAQVKSAQMAATGAPQGATTNKADSGGGLNLMFGIMGAFFLLIALGLGVYAARLRKF